MDKFELILVLVCFYEFQKQGAHGALVIFVLEVGTSIYTGSSTALTIYFRYYRGNYLFNIEYEFEICKPF